MVERGTLLRCCTFTGTEGSNPSLSAMNINQSDGDEKFIPDLIRGIPPSPPFYAKATNGRPSEKLITTENVERWLSG